jgi:hypothetical protein
VLPALLIELTSIEQVFLNFENGDSTSSRDD